MECAWAGAWVSERSSGCRSDLRIARRCIEALALITEAVEPPTSWITLPNGVVLVDGRSGNCQTTGSAPGGSRGASAASAASGPLTRPSAPAQSSPERRNRMSPVTAQI